MEADRSSFVSMPDSSTQERLTYTRLPLFFDISRWKILVVGGGTIASRRIRTLLTFGPEVTVVSGSLAEDLAGRAIFPDAREENSAAGDSSLNPGMTADHQAEEAVEAVDRKPCFGRLLWKKAHFELSFLTAAPWQMVLACTDDAELNSQIYGRCRELGILANNASNQKECDFFFPAIVTGDGIVIGISSDGSDHGKVRKTAAKIRSEYGD